MKTYRIGTVVGLAIALIAYPGENLWAAKKHAPAAPAQGNTRANPKDPGGHSAAGVEFAKKKEYDKAVEEFSKAIQSEPNDPKNYFNRATAYRGLNKFTEAYGDYSKAIELSPQMTAAFIGRGEVLLQQKQPDNALADFDKAIQIEPNNASARRFRG